MVEMKKNHGGIVLEVFLGKGRVRVGADQLEILRTEPQDDKWYAKVADQCWRNARARAIEQVKSCLAYEIAQVPPVADRRPSKLRKVGG